MSKQKKRINEETANETGKTEGTKERDYAGGRERESEWGKRLDTATPPSLRIREIIEFNYWMKT